MVKIQKSVHGYPCTGTQRVKSVETSHQSHENGFSFGFGFNFNGFGFGFKAYATSFTRMDSDSDSDSDFLIRHGARFRKEFRTGEVERPVGDEKRR